MENNCTCTLYQSQINHGKKIVHAHYTRVTYAEDWAPSDPTTSSNTNKKSSETEQCILS